MESKNVVRVLSTLNLPEPEMRAIGSISPRIDLVHSDTEPYVWKPLLPEAEIWLCQVPQVLLARHFGPKLRWRRRAIC